MCDKKLRETYMKKIQSEVAKLEKMGTSELQTKVIDKCITKVFENEFQNRI